MGAAQPTAGSKPRARVAAAAIQSRFLSSVGVPLATAQRNKRLGVDDERLGVGRLGVREDLDGLLAGARGLEDLGVARGQRALGERGGPVEVARGNGAAGERGAAERDARQVDEQRRVRRVVAQRRAPRLRGRFELTRLGAALPRVGAVVDEILQDLIGDGAERLAGRDPRGRALGDAARRCRDEDDGDEDDEAALGGGADHVAARAKAMRSDSGGAASAAARASGVVASAGASATSAARRSPVAASATRSAVRRSARA